MFQAILGLLKHAFPPNISHISYCSNAGNNFDALKLISKSKQIQTFIERIKIHFTGKQKIDVQTWHIN